jgi:iron complex outermembrane receptor protein
MSPNWKSMKNKTAAASRRSGRFILKSKTRLRKDFLCASVLAAGALLSPAADTSATNAPSGSLADLSVEQLMNESVTSVAKRETKFNESAAAIYVITQDDIRRFGITTIPDALRMVPGLDVAQINSHEWAVSARGFDNEFANKLLVLVDGRSVYGTGYGGVVWDAQDMPMEDIDRIEVIRGPGASLWGANAVNGVINIITKSAKETQGTLVSVTGGTYDQPTTTVRYGGQLATNLFFRVYGKVSNGGGLVTSTGQDAPDRTLNVQGGARLDWEPSDENKFTLQGDMYRDRLVENQEIPSLSPPYSLNFNEVNYDSGGNVLGRWTHDFSETSSFTVQAYYDRFTEEQAGAAETANTVDFDAQHRFALGTRNDITWGLGYRDVQADFRSSFFVGWNPPTSHDELLSSFVQDEISLLPDRLKLTLGSKFEHNNYTGFEFEPNARLSWTPTEHQTVWAAISRAVRTPAWSDLHFNANLDVIPPMPPVSPLPVLISAHGNPNLDDEELIAYELGYRVEVTKHVSLDVAGFYNDYRDLIAPTGLTTGVFAGSTPPYAQVVSIDENAGSAHTYGVEISARWDVTDRWHLTANYSRLNTQFGFSSSYLQAGPENQFQILSSLDLPYHFELNGAVYYVDQTVAQYGIGQMSIPSYVRFDLGVVWHPTKNWELGIWGQNLAQDQHIEYTSYKTALVTEIPRGVVARVTLHF